MNTSVEAVWAALEELNDPEIPVISLRELGILRDVHSAPDGSLEVVITPTYSGCPAMSQIEEDVRATLQRAGISARVMTRLSPAWTTDWMTDAGKEKLRAYGIAPPHQTPAGSKVVNFISKPPKDEIVPCPHCGSAHTVESSHFGSTACKALYKCRDCQEPFDYFKPY
ncbi:MAG: phenylacetate-CoA oxygenase subunit PaaJ [Betaproteobacteria bacterium]|nr:phenylacetate-CoA oxygenase subunit PaaJ [Betaproteobacteria bacterium]